jgi:hypothetical protein
VAGFGGWKDGQAVAAGFAGAGVLAAAVVEAVLLEEDEEAPSESFFAAALYESLR